MRMLFGLNNAQITYQQAVDIILTTVRWRIALMYVEDVMFFSSSFGSNTAHLRTVLELLKSTCMTLRLSKLKFFHTEVD